MSDSEPGRDPLDVAADEAAEIMALRGKASWADLVGSLRYAAEKAQQRYQMAMRLEAAFAADGGQLPLFPEAVPVLRKPRAKGRRMMHDDGGVFRCPKCKESAEIPKVISADARKRGVPCPKCNAVS